MRPFCTFVFLIIYLTVLPLMGTSQVPTSGQIAYYPFDGTYNDASGNNRTGTATEVTFTTDRFGNASKAAFFDGINDFVKVNWGQLQGNAARTISLWFKSAAPVSRNSFLLSFGADAPNQSCIIGNYGTDTDSWFGLLGFNANVTIAPNAYFDGNWHQIMAVHNGSSASIYIDGKLLTTQNFTLSTANSALFIGCSFNGFTFYEGAIDDIRIYNRALTNTEITALYNAEKPSTTLPNVVAGYTDVKPTVSEVGEANFAIDIPLPQGTRIQPKVSVSYNSGSSNGILGLKMSLNAIRTINRVGATLAQDTINDPVDFDRLDRLVLDGERLQVTNTVGYLQDGSEYLQEQNSFTKVNMSNGAFTAYSKDGLIWDFGRTSDSKIELPGTTDKPLAWNLNRITDQKGNYADFIYTENNSTGENYLSEIRYGGNLRANTLHYVSIKFIYEDRPDVITKYILGTMTKITKRLREIIITDNNKPFRKTLFKYSDERTFSKLRFIQEIGRDGVSAFKPTELIWQQQPTSLGFILNGTWNTHNWQNEIQIGDFNGDLKQDFIGRLNGSSSMNSIALSTGGNFFNYTWNFNSLNLSNIDWSKVIVTDFNNDQKTDMLIPHPNTGIQVGISNGQNAFNFSQWSNNVINTDKIQVGDFNGDGFLDLFAYENSSRKWKFYLSIKGSRFDSIESNVQLPAPSEIFSMAAGEWSGDNQTDLIYFVEGQANINVLLSEGRSFRTETWAKNKYFDWRGTYQRMVGDYNGDGLTDFSWTFNENYGTWHVELCTGKGFKNEQRSASWFGDRYSKGYSFDLNADGVSDLLSMDNFFNYYSAISNTINYTTTKLTGSLGSTQNVLADFSGDGNIDLATRNGGSWTVSFGNFEKDLVNEVKLGNKSSFKFQYATLNDPTVYTKGKTAVLPCIDVASQQIVVKNMHQSNGIGGSNKTNYQYLGARINIEGRGFRGFEKIITTADATKTINEVTFEFDEHCLTSRVRSSITKNFDGKILASVENKIKLVNQGKGVFRSYYEETKNTTFDLYSSNTSWSLLNQIVDDFGNVTYALTTTSDGLKTTVTNLDENNTNRWFLGRLKSSTITETARNGKFQDKNSNFEYEADGYLSIENSMPNHATKWRKQEHFYDIFGNETALKTSAFGIQPFLNKTYFDALGRFKTKEENVKGHITIAEHQDGLPSKITDPNGRIQEVLTRDGFDRILSVKNFDQTITTTKYSLCDGCGETKAYMLVETQTTGRPQTLEFRDMFGRVIRMETKDWQDRTIITEVRYDAKGIETARSEPYFRGKTPRWNYTTYDDHGQVTNQVLADDRQFVQKHSLLTNGLKQVEFLPQFDAPKRTKVLDSKGQAVSVTDVAGKTLTYILDQNGNIESAINHRGHTVTEEYDIKGVRTKMSDLNAGTYLFENDGLGRLIKTTNPQGDVTIQTWDVLSRVLSIREKEGLITNIYDQGQYSIGYPSQQLFAGGSKTFTRDNRGNLSNVKYKYDNYPERSFSYAYDVNNNLVAITYPNGQRIKFYYTYNGFLVQISLIVGNKENIILTVLERDEYNKLISYKLGNGVTRLRNFDPISQLLKSVTAGTDATASNLQHLRYEHTASGKIASREDVIFSQKETFQYTEQEQVKLAFVNGEQVLEMKYNDLGSIIYKSNVGTYNYGEGGKGPQVLTSIDHSTAKNCIYPFNGVITSTSYNYAQTVKNATDEVRLYYDGDRGKFKQENYKNGTLVKIRWYFGGGYFEDVEAGITTSFLQISADGELVAYAATKGAEPTKMVYILNDHIGSPYAHLDQQAQILQRFNFDVWGAPREHADWKKYLLDPNIASETKITFTGHEGLGIEGLIFMNARVYDPILGQFSSPDPIIQFYDDLRSYNRFSYVLNNPLSFTDPSGMGGIGDFFKEFISFAVSFAIMVATGVPASFTAALLTGAKAGAAAGLVSALLNGGSPGDVLKATFMGGVMGAIQGGIGFEIGEFFGHELNPFTQSKAFFQKTVVHGLTQGGLTAIQGGDFRATFASTFAASYVMGGARTKIGSGSLKTFIAGMVGGTVSEISGGSFASGAAAAAFVEHFNDQSASGKDGELSWSEAGDHYNSGSGSAITVDLSKIDLSNVNSGIFSNSDCGCKPISLLFGERASWSQGVVFGSITLCNVDAKTVIAKPDFYNFNRQPYYSLKSLPKELLVPTIKANTGILIRNLYTQANKDYLYISNFFQSGKPFQINFNGSKTIR